PQPADQITHRKRRGIATRYDRTARIYQAALYIAAVFLWTR
ncbi:MAG: hypothetical protein QOF84_7169, partial [Streptomyces sp.]|nr:hypothetical protein [Streptomyces sp.]